MGGEERERERQTDREIARDQWYLSGLGRDNCGDTNKFERRTGGEKVRVE